MLFKKPTRITIGVPGRPTRVASVQGASNTEKDIAWITTAALPPACAVMTPRASFFHAPAPVF